MMLVGAFRRAAFGLALFLCDTTQVVVVRTFQFVCVRCACVCVVGRSILACGCCVFVCALRDDAPHTSSSDSESHFMHTSEFENGSVYLGVVQYLYVLYIHHEEGVVCVVEELRKRYKYLSLS